MGVKGLSTYAEDSCPGAQELLRLRRNFNPAAGAARRTIVVDGHGLLLKLYHADWMHGGQFVELRQECRSFVEAWREAGFELVFIFDGGFDDVKRSTWVQRRRKDRRKAEKVFEYLRLGAGGGRPGAAAAAAQAPHPNRKDEKRLRVLPIGLSHHMRGALRSLGAAVFNSVGEADGALATFCEAHNCWGVLGQDSDFIVFGVARYLTLGTCRVTKGMVEVVAIHSAAVAASLHLSPAQLPLLGALCGNDFIEPLELMRFHVRAIDANGGSAAEKMAAAAEKVVAGGEDECKDECKDGDAKAATPRGEARQERERDRVPKPQDVLAAVARFLSSGGGGGGGISTAAQWKELLAQQPDAIERASRMQYSGNGHEERRLAWCEKVGAAAAAYDRAATGAATAAQMAASAVPARLLSAHQAAQVPAGLLSILLRRQNNLGATLDGAALHNAALAASQAVDAGGGRGGTGVGGSGNGGDGDEQKERDGGNSFVGTALPWASSIDAMQPLRSRYYAVLLPAAAANDDDMVQEWLADAPRLEAPRSVAPCAETRRALSSLLPMQSLWAQGRAVGARAWLRVMGFGDLQVGAAVARARGKGGGKGGGGKGGGKGSALFPGVADKHAIACGALRYLLSAECARAAELRPSTGAPHGDDGEVTTAAAAPRGAPVVLLEGEFAALLVQLVAPPAWHWKYGSTRGRRSKAVAARAVHAASLFMRAVMQTMDVNAACGSPIAPRDAAAFNCFNGVLFHAKAAQAAQLAPGAAARPCSHHSSGGASSNPWVGEVLLALCDGDRQAADLFGRLRAFVLGTAAASSPLAAAPAAAPQPPPPQLSAAAAPFELGAGSAGGGGGKGKDPTAHLAALPAPLADALVQYSRDVGVGAECVKRDGEFMEIKLSAKLSAAERAAVHSFAEATPHLASCTEGKGPARHVVLSAAVGCERVKAPAKGKSKGRGKGRGKGKGNLRGKGRSHRGEGKGRGKDDRTQE